MAELLKQPLYADASSYWRFDGNLNDDKGNNNASNGAYAAIENEGKFDKCVLLPSGGYLTHGRTGLSYSAMSISFWIKPLWNGNDNTLHGIWQNNNNSNVNQANWVSLFKYSNNYLYWRVYGPSAENFDVAFDASSYFVKDTWTHIVVYYSSAGSGVYINNTLVASRGAITAPNNFLDTTCRIGYGHQTTAEGSRFSDFAIFPRVITSGEVTSLFNSGVGSLNKLVYPKRSRIIGSINGVDKSEYSLLEDRRRSRFVGSVAKLGDSADNPVESAVRLMKMRPDVVNGYYWIKTKYMTTAVLTYCNFTWHGGGWMRLNSSLASLSSEKGSTPTWWATNGDINWQPEFAYANNVGGGCGDNRAEIKVTCSTLDYTEALVLVYRVSTIIQCMGFTGQTSVGYYDIAYSRYAGSSTSYGTCNWGDNVWAHACCSAAIGTCKKYWAVLCSFANQTPISMTSQCAGDDTGQYYNYYYVR